MHALFTAFVIASALGTIFLALALVSVAFVEFVTRRF